MHSSGLSVFDDGGERQFGNYLPSTGSLCPATDHQKLDLTKPFLSLSPLALKEPLHPPCVRPKGWSVGGGGDE